MSGITTTLFQRPRDPNFNQTTLLLSGNFPTNGAQNNTFLDSSSNNFTITRNPTTGPNAPTQGTLSPYSQTGWGVNFNRGRLNATLTGKAPGTGSFTYELFFWSNDRAADLSNTSALFSSRGGGTGSDGIDVKVESTGSIVVGTAAATLFASAAGTAVLNTWYHLAIVRNGSTDCTVYLNGASIGTFGFSNNCTSTDLYIGVFGGASNDWFRGYISNFRYTRDAVYTANFATPTSQLEVINNTEFLTCRSNRLVDLSANAFAITPAVLNGTSPAVQPFSPFRPSGAYTTTAVGGSGYFDGTGDYLTVPYNSVFDIPLNGQATFECWVYTGSSSAGGVMAGRNWAWGSGGPTWGFMVVSGVTPRWAIAGTGSATFVLAQSTINGSLNSWNHYVFTRDSSNVVRIFVNGVLGVARTDGQAMTSASGDVFIGIASNLNAGSTFNGQMSDLRFIKGSVPTAYQTSSTTVGAQIFSPPTAPLTRTSQGAVSSDVALLLNFTNAGIVDSTAKNVLETVGNAQISTTVSRFGGTSIYLDGNGDYLQTVPNQLYNLGASDFTIEFWIYPVNFSAVVYPVYSTSARAKTDALALELNTSGQIAAYATNSGGGAWSMFSAQIFGTLTANAWNHIALVRNGTQFRGYVNGVQGALSSTSSNAIAAFDGFNIGTNGAGSGFVNGYIDDLRITRFARYTAAFNVPTIGFTDR